jgi:hypothetical protein
MPAFTIPEQHARGFARLLGLSSDEGDKVEKALSSAKSVNVKELTDLVVAALPVLTKKEAREVIEALMSLYSVRTGMDMSIDSFVVALLEAAQQTTSNVPDEHATQPLEVVRATLRTLLSVRPLSIIAKARSLHTDHENTFCNARILTDLRAVFDADVNEAPAGFVMAHILKLGYHHAGRHTELHIAMDKIDVDTMIRALQRAKAKSATLTTISKQSGFDVLAD